MHTSLVCKLFSALLNYFYIQCLCSKIFSVVINVLAEILTLMHKETGKLCLLFGFVLCEWLLIAPGAYGMTHQLTG